MAYVIEECEYCDGTGIIDDNACHNCDGSGVERTYET